jgi:predicted TIM-barrel fold metal-dependent hydrolase
MEQVAMKYPRVNFLMGHSGFGDWANAVRVAHDYPNLYLELTAVYIAHDWANQPCGSGSPVPFLSHLQLNGIIEYMCEHAGSEKIVYGDDMPWYSPHYAAGAVLFAEISDVDRHNILHRNAEELIRPYLSD